MRLTKYFLLILILLLPLLVSPVSAQIPDEPTTSRTGEAEVPLDSPAAIVPQTDNHLNADWFESFDDITLLPVQGWVLVNMSSPVGVTGWFQGNETVFPAFEGAANSYIGTNFNNVAGSGTISNWLLLPSQTIKNGDVFTFYSRAADQVYPDRLEVRLSTNGASIDVGSDAFSTGDFSTLLLSINPDLLQDVYPEVWTQYTITIEGLPRSYQGRLAFRYFVSAGGPLGSNSNYIGIDSVSYTEGPWHQFLPMVTR